MVVPIFDLNKIVYSMFRTGIDLFGNANVVNDYVSVLQHILSQCTIHCIGILG